jgi:hypothetical protein
MLLAPEWSAFRIAWGAAAAPRRYEEFESVGRPRSVTFPSGVFIADANLI